MVPKKILTIKLRAMGDTVLLTAPLVELRKNFPDAQIDTMVLTPWVSLVENHPAINRVWAYDRHEDKASRAKAVASMALKVRKEKYDWVFCFHASPSSSMIAFATGAKTRAIHFHGHNHKNTYSTVEIPGKGTLKPVIERDMDTLRAAGLQIPPGRTPQLFVPPSDADAAYRLLQSNGLKGPILGLGLGSSRPTKMWPIERFAVLALDWLQKTGGSVIAFGSRDEELLSNRFLMEVEKDLADRNLSAGEKKSIRDRVLTENRLSVKNLCAMVARLSVYMGNDSGPKHIAVALDVPTVTLFGPEHPFEWHPYSTDRHPYFFVENLSCRKDADPGMPAWCGLNICTIEEHQCMNRIGVDAVVEKLLKIYRKDGA